MIGVQAIEGYLCYAGCTSASRMYLEQTTEQDAPESNIMSVSCPLILPVVYATFLGMFGVEMGDVCSTVRAS